jgi:hypothetical protein
MAGDELFLFQEPWVSELTRRRIQARRKRRLTYDCMNATVRPGELVRCKQGHQFPKLAHSQVEGLGLRSVLSGRSSSICQKCKDFDQETTE